MPDTILYWPFLITNILWTLEEMGTGNIGHNINLDKIRFEPTCNGIEHDLSSQTLKFLWASFSRVTSSHTMTSPVVVPTKWVNFINIGSKEKQKKPKAVLTDHIYCQVKNYLNYYHEPVGANQEVESAVMDGNPYSWLQNPDSES